ncbi:MAG: lysophospholipid acyltransferase family protein [Romboutsia sp.]
MNFLFFKGILGQLSGFVKVIPSYIKFKLSPDKYTLDEKFKIVQNHATKSLEDANIELIVSGYENLPDTNVLFVANHANWVDAFIMLSIVDRPVGMIIAKEANWEKFSLIKGWSNMINCLYLDRKNNRNAIKTMNIASEILKTKSSMGVFPEGIVTRSDSLVNFKDGAFRMAIKAQVPVVPIVIKNSKDVFVPSSRWLGNLYSPTVHIEILPPVYDHMENVKMKTKELSTIVKSNMLHSINDTLCTNSNIS